MKARHNSVSAVRGFTLIEALVTIVNYTTPPSTSSCNVGNILPGAQSYGWYMDLTGNGVGEQGVTSALIVGGLVTFSTNRAVATPGACSSALGQARGYWVNLLNSSAAIGTNVCSSSNERSATFIGGGLPPSPVAGVVSINGSPQEVVIGAIPRDPLSGPNSSVGSQQFKPFISGARKRKYWHTTGDTH